MPMHKCLGHEAPQMLSPGAVSIGLYKVEANSFKEGTIPNEKTQEL